MLAASAAWAYNSASDWQAFESITQTSEQPGETPNGAPPASANPPKNIAKLILGSIGVVYGDIGTSPLYALRESLHAASRDGLTPDDVYGVISLLIWTLIIIVTIKYVLLIMRADNRGEGGPLSLVALSFAPFVVPVTLAIIVGLFLMQNRGTETVSTFFGPIMVVWFVAMAAMGLWHISDDLSVLTALNPVHALYFLWTNGFASFIVLGSVFLAVTGGEAFYADMGHFGRKPIRMAWAMLVFPALTLSYLGQGALVLSHPDTSHNPFFLMAPGWALFPLVLLATAATVIASQAVISGAFSMMHQAVQMGLLPRLEIRHTSKPQHGQIFFPRVNMILVVGFLIFFLAFGSSPTLASAYGIG